ncbi:hypothetical protein Agub_g14021, partial [Astrephomene gubernaculifera]
MADRGDSSALEASWSDLITNKGWNTVAIQGAILKADLAGCARPRHLNSLEDIPQWVQGVKPCLLPWEYPKTGILAPPAGHTPHIIYRPAQGFSNASSFISWHSSCIDNIDKQVALKFTTTVSTPNLEWAFLLVAGHLQPQTSKAPHAAGRQAASSTSSSPEAGPAAGASSPAACSSSAARPPPPASSPVPCFFAYFLPFNPASDVKKGEPLCLSWLSRRLRQHRDVREDRDVHAWRQDRSRWRVHPATGLPEAERNVTLHAYGDLGSAGGSSKPMHCGLVESVLTGGCFYYSTRPWRLKPDAPEGVAIKEPVYGDKHQGFLPRGDCACEDNCCGKNRARLALQQLRSEGVQYKLEIRRVSLERDRNDLGVFALEYIPEGTYLAEYVGEWITSMEVQDRERLYQPVGLHYMYDMEQRHELSKEEAATALMAVDGTHIGNVSRFINHRCEGANLKSVNVCMGGLDESQMAVLLRTLRALQPGEELTLDYQQGRSVEVKAEIRANPRGEVRCRCGAPKCLGVVFPRIDVDGEDRVLQRGTGGAGGRGGGGRGGAGAGRGAGGGGRGGGRAPQHHQHPPGRPGSSRQAIGVVAGPSHCPSGAAAAAATTSNRGGGAGAAGADAVCRQGRTSLHYHAGGGGGRGGGGGAGGGASCGQSGLEAPSSAAVTTGGAPDNSSACAGSVGSPAGAGVAARGGGGAGGGGRGGGGGAGAVGRGRGQREEADAGGDAAGTGGAKEVAFGGEATAASSPGGKADRRRRTGGSTLTFAQPPPPQPRTAGTVALLAEPMLAVASSHAEAVVGGTTAAFSAGPAITPATGTPAAAAAATAAATVAAAAAAPAAAKRHRGEQGAGHTLAAGSPSRRRLGGSDSRMVVEVEPEVGSVGADSGSTAASGSGGGGMTTAGADEEGLLAETTAAAARAGVVTGAAVAMEAARSGGGGAAASCCLSGSRTWGEMEEEQMEEEQMEEEQVEVEQVEVEQVEVVPGDGDDDGGHAGRNGAAAHAAAAASPPLHGVQAASPPPASRRLASHTRKPAAGGRRRSCKLQAASSCDGSGGGGAAAVVAAPAAVGSAAAAAAAAGGSSSGGGGRGSTAQQVPATAGLMDVGEEE